MSCLQLTKQLKFIKFLCWTYVLKVKQWTVRYFKEVVFIQKYLRKSIEKGLDTQTSHQWSTPPLFTDLLLGLTSSRQFLCACGSSYKHKRSLLQHQKYECNQEPQFGCEHCAYKAKRRTHLRSHLALKHGIVLDS